MQTPSPAQTRALIHLADRPGGAKLLDYSRPTRTALMTRGWMNDIWGVRRFTGQFHITALGFAALFATTDGRRYLEGLWSAAHLAHAAAQGDIDSPAALDNMITAFEVMTESAVRDEIAGRLAAADDLHQRATFTLARLAHATHMPLWADADIIVRAARDLHTKWVSHRAGLVVQALLES